MPTTVYVLDSDPAQRAWIQSALGRSIDAFVFVDDHQALLADVPAAGSACLIVAAEPDEEATLGLVRELRRRGALLPVIVLGSHRAFRTAVSIARLEATDFIERPATARQLRAAVRRACAGVK